MRPYTEPFVRTSRTEIKPMDDCDLRWLKKKMYGGSWKRFLEDLLKRQYSRPFIAKINGQCEVDADRITEIMANGGK